MPTLNYAVSISGLGGSINKAIPRTADGGANREITVPRGFTGTLSTRTSDTAGTLTLESGHGITTSAIIDIYWTGGARYGVTVGTVSGTSVPFSSGTGTNLPAQDTAVVASIPVAFNAAIDGDELALFGIQQTYASASESAVSRVAFFDNTDTGVATLNLTANIPRVFDIEGGDANALTGNPIVTGSVSNGSGTNDATLKILWVQDSTP